MARLRAALACPIPQRPDFPSAIVPVGSLVVPGTGRGALAVGERCKASTAGRGERMPVWGDAHRFAGEKRGFPSFVLMAGERKQEGWGAGWHRHGATALPAPHPRYPSGHGGRCSRGRMAQRRAGRRCGASRPDPQLPAPQCKTAAARRYTFAFCNGGCGSARHRGNSLSGWTSCRKNCAVAWLTFGVAIFLKIVLLVDTWTTADRGSSPSTRTPRRKQHVEDSVHGICPAHLPHWSG